MQSEKLVRIECPNFVAGLVVRDGRVVHAAPILRNLWFNDKQRKRIDLVGKTEDEARKIIYSRGWKATICKT